MNHHRFLINEAINSGPFCKKALKPTSAAAPAEEGGENTKDVLKKILLNAALIPAAGLTGMAVGGTGGWLTGDLLSVLLKGKPVQDWARMGQTIGQGVGLVGGSLGGGYAAHRLTRKDDESGAIKNASSAIEGAVEKSTEAPKTEGNKALLREILLHAAYVPVGAWAGHNIGGRLGKWVGGKSGQGAGKTLGLFGGAVWGRDIAQRLSKMPEKKDEKKSS